MPKVSVICPTYNRSTAIRATIASVVAQSWSDWEMLVVSDGSTDDTDDVVRSMAASDGRVRLISTHAHGDPSEPRNIGLAAASGDVIAYLDHDDRWRPDHLAVVVDLMDSGAEIVATGNVYQDEGGVVRQRSRSAAMCWHPEIQLLGAVFETSRVSHIRSLVDEAGGWREVPGFEDWDLWQRISDHGHRFTTINERTVRMQSRDSTRRHSLPPRFRLPFALFDDPADARAALDLLAEPQSQQRLRRAGLADSRDWLRRLIQSDEMVLPVGWSGDVVREYIGRSRSRAHGAGLVVARHRGGYAISQPLYCPTPEHAARIAAAAQRDRPAVLGLIHELASPWRPRRPDPDAPAPAHGPATALTRPGSSDDRA